MTTPAWEAARSDRFKETIELYIATTAENLLRMHGIAVEPERLARAVVGRLQNAVNDAMAICAKTGREVALGTRHTFGCRSPSRGTGRAARGRRLGRHG